MITERQQRLIDKCKSAGYGWKMFAESVEQQGWCSRAQEDTLYRMWQRLAAHSTTRRNTTRDIDSDISDYEAMQSGDYF